MEGSDYSSPETFSESEQKLIQPFFSNMDRSIFALVNLPEVIKGTLFSRYSRSDKSVRRILLDEFIKNKDIFEEKEGVPQAGSSFILAQEKAEQFYERVLVGYGDDSVAELAGTHVAFEYISSLAADVLTDSRLGLSYLEKSARYVLFDKKVNGKYLWYREPKIMESRHEPIYTELMDRIFDIYTERMPMVIAHVKEVTPKDPTATDRAYESACRAKACDILKNMLTAGRLTNLGIYGNGRAFEYLLTKLYSSNLTEANHIGTVLHEEMRKVLPSFVKRAQPSEYIIGTRNDMVSYTSKASPGMTEGTEPYLELVDYDPNGEDKVLAGMLYPYAHLSMTQLKEDVGRMGPEQKKELIRTYLSKRRNRRDKPGRALENLYYTFEMSANYGIFRDIHRHRILSTEKQALTANLGYDTPVELGQIGLENEYRKLMDDAKGVYSKIAETMPIEAQYAVPRAFHLRWYITINLRELYHLLELRSQKQGHPDYRKLAQNMRNVIANVHPALVEYMQVDMNEYALPRIESEKRIDEKMAKLNQKEQEKKG